MSRNPRCRWPSRSWKRSWTSRSLSAAPGEVSIDALGEAIVRQAQSVLEQAAEIKEIAKRGKDPLSGRADAWA